MADLMYVNKQDQLESSLLGSSSKLRDEAAQKGADQKTSVELSQTQKLKKEQSLIDFKGMLEAYRQRTEFSFPYTMMQVADVMFINDKKLVTLEYIFYQNDGKYSALAELPKTQHNALG